MLAKGVPYRQKVYTFSTIIAHVPIFGAGSIFRSHLMLFIHQYLPFC